MKKSGVSIYSACKEHALEIPVFGTWKSVMRLPRLTSGVFSELLPSDYGLLIELLKAATCKKCKAYKFHIIYFRVLS